MFQLKRVILQVLIVALTFVPHAHATLKALHTVQQLNLNDYMGTWFEVARVPNLFQQDCVRNTIVRYRFNADGKIVVQNHCQLSSGKLKAADALATVPDFNKPGQWQFGFFQILGRSLITVPYWILAVNTHRYAIVGQPSRDYGWILARQPRLNLSDWKMLQQALSEQGYNPCRFKLFPQSGGTSQVLPLCELFSN